MFNYEFQAQYHREELKKQSEHQRLIKQLQGDSPKKNNLSRTLAWTGSLLYKLGDTLLKRYGEHADVTSIQNFNNNTRVELP